MLLFYFMNFWQSDETIGLPEIAALLIVGFGLIALSATLRRLLHHNSKGINHLKEVHLSQTGSQSLNLHETR